VVVVDSQPTATSELADLFIEVRPEDHFDVIWTMRALLQGLPVSDGLWGHVNQEAVRELVGRMKTCKYGAVFFGLGLAQTGVGHANVEALLSLVEELNAHTRFIARRLRIPGDVTGADLVLCWQTGFPFAVNLSRGYPRYNPGEYSAADLLSRNEVDACLLVGSDVIEKLPPAAQNALSRIPTIFVDYPNCPTHIEPRVQLTTAIYGIHTPGMAYRMDEIPIPLRKLTPSPFPTDHEVLAAVERAVIDRRANCRVSFG
jgi:formylmethanofuran dehydrogenase subunit B